MKIECIKWIMKAHTSILVQGRKTSRNDWKIVDWDAKHHLKLELYILDPETNSTEPDEFLHSLLSHLDLPSLRCVLKQDISQEDPSDITEKLLTGT